MTVAGQNVSGLFRFDDRGDMISFEARRYCNRNGGATLENWLVRALPEGYREFEGVRVTARLEVTWKLDGGDITWLRLEIMEIRYNMTTE